MRSPRHRRVVALVVLSAALLADGLLLSPGPAVAIIDPPNARWKLDDGIGTTADDFIGSADGTVAGGATWITSGAAAGTGALHLDGTDDVVSIPSSPTLEPSEATITLWVRGDPQHKPRNGDVVFEKGSFACNGPSYGLYVAATGFTVALRTPAGTQFTGTTADSAGADLWNGSWHFVSLSIGLNSSVPPQQYVRISADGGMAGIFFPTGAVGQTSAIHYAGATHSELVVGGPVDATCGKTTFKGDIDDVRLYDDPDFGHTAASQMPPETITMSNLAPVQIYPGQQVSTSVDLSPAPRFGQVAWAYLNQDGSDAGLCCYVNLNLSASPTNHVAATGPGPLVKGTYQLRAVFNAGPPYSQRITSTTLTVVGYASSTTVAVTNDPKIAYDYVRLSAQVTSTAISGNQTPTGSVKFWDTTGVTPILLGTRTLIAGSAGTANVTFDTNSLGGGTHKIKAEYVGDTIRAGSMSSSIDVVVQKRTPTVTLDAPTWQLEANVPFTIGAIVSAAVPYAPNATLTFRRVGASAAICTLAVAGPRTDCLVPGQPVGTPQFTVEYSGNADVAGATSAPVGVTVVADTARADNVGVQYTTFYPYRDSYRDTVAIRGYRQEAISVTIKIYNPSGSLSKTISIPAGLWDYSYTWTGRTSTDTIKAEGKYKIVQTLKDAVGNVKTVTSYVTLSKKHIVYTTKTITKTGSSITAKGTALAGGSVTVNTTSGYTKLSATSGAGQWAGAGWSLTLPSAAVYSYFYVRVYGRRSSGTGTVRMGAQQFSRTGCAYSTSTDWKESCFGQFVNIPVTSGTTSYYYKTVNLPSDYRSGTHVRVMVGTYGGTVYIYKAQVVVRYGYLTY